MIIKKETLFVRAIITSTGRASSVIQSGYRNMIFFHTSCFSFAELAHGYVGADLAAVCKEAGLMSFKRCLAENEVTSSLDDRVREETLKECLLVTREDIMAAFRQVRPSAMREVAIDVPKVSLFTFQLRNTRLWRDIATSPEN